MSTTKLYQDENNFTSHITPAEIEIYQLKNPRDRWVCLRNMPDFPKRTNVNTSLIGQIRN